MNLRLTAAWFAQDANASNRKAEQAYVEKLATLDLAIALYAQQDCSSDTTLKLVAALTPQLAARTSSVPQPGNKRGVEQSVCSVVNLRLLPSSEETLRV